MKTPAPVTPRTLSDASELRTLVASRPGPRVSLYVPLLRSIPDAKSNSVAYEGAVTDAAQALGAAGLAPAEVQGMRERLAAVETDLRKLDRRASGLAVFHDRVALHAYALAGEPSRCVVVAENFALRPLLAALRRDRRHRVLAFSAKRVALYEGDASGLEPVSVPGIPTSLEDVLGSEVTEKELRVATTQGGKGSPQYYSHDSGRDERKLDLERFHLKFARALEKALEGRAEPLVLVATQVNQAGLRSELRLPALLPEGVQTNPDHLAPDELHARCWPLVERAVDAEAARIAAEYERAVNRGKGLHRIDDVAAAAAAGRVRRLWVGRDERVPGAVDMASGALLGGRTSEDVLDGIVTLVLRHAGEVIAGAPIPSGTQLAAELH